GPRAGSARDGSTKGTTDATLPRSARARPRCAHAAQRNTSPRPRSGRRTGTGARRRSSGPPFAPALQSEDLVDHLAAKLLKTDGVLLSLDHGSRYLSYHAGMTFGSHVHPRVRSAGDESGAGRERLSARPRRTHGIEFRRDVFRAVFFVEPRCRRVAENTRLRLG